MRASITSDEDEEGGREEREDDTHIRNSCSQREEGTEGGEDEVVDGCRMFARTD